MSKVKDIVAGVISPITGVFKARQERKQAVETAQIKLNQALSDNEKQVTFNDQEWEAINVALAGTSWKDEYVTLSVVSILNIMVIGGIAQAFGYSQVLAGIAIAIGALGSAGVDVGLIMEATIFAALGLNVWRRV